MAFEPRDNSCALFKNDKKGNEKAPDYTGNGMVNGAIVKISAWVKDGKKGKFLSLSFQNPSASQLKPSVPTSFVADDDDNLPF